MGEHTRDFGRGVELFNRGRYFEAHQEWDKLWLGEARDTPPKLFIQGLIMVAGAFAHMRKNEYPGAVKLLEKGIKRLAEYRNIGTGLMDVDGFLDALNALYAKLRAEGGAAPEAATPKIRTIP